MICINAFFVALKHIFSSSIEVQTRDSINHVLGKPTGEEKAKIDIAIKNAANAIKVYLNKDFTAAMNRYSGGLKR